MSLKNDFKMYDTASIAICITDKSSDVPGL